MEETRICAVVLENANRSYDRIYHYSVPPGIQNRLVTGMRVSVPFGRGGKLRTAWFLDYIDKSEHKNLKEIVDVADEFPLLDKNMFRLAKMIRDRYFCSYGTAISAMLPSGMKIKRERIVRTNEGEERNYDEFMKKIGGDRQKLKNMIDAGEVEIIEKTGKAASAKTLQAARLAIPPQEAMEMLENGDFKNRKHMKIVEILLEYDSVTVTDFEAFENISRSVIKTVGKKGIIEIFQKKIQRYGTEKAEPEKPKKIVLNSEQKNAVEKVGKSITGGVFDSYLLHGVTGSGKTEVYLRLTRMVIDMGRQVIVLVPEISLTPMMIRRFESRFPGEVAVLHSRLSMGERYDQWMLIKNKKAKIALGARSCIFAPFDNMGLVIVDEEHEPSFSSDMTPRYNAIDVAAMRCRLENAVLLAGSATPSISLYHAMKAKNKVIRLEKRAGTGTVPGISVVDMKEELQQGNTGTLSRQLREAIARNIEKGEQTLLFLNRRGYASFLLCKACGNTNKCKYCDISMTWHKNINSLVCHYCGHMIPAPATCPECHQAEIQPFGIGTQKVEEEIRSVFPDAGIIRMDSDTTGYKDSHMAILDRFKNEGIDILIGTQMIAKGHDFPNITLVGILAADTLLAGYDYNSQERAFQLIVQASGRAGRGEKPGRAIIQAYNTDAYALQYGVKQDYEAFYAAETALREKLGYPPYGMLAQILISTADKNEGRRWADFAGKVIAGRGIEVSETAYAPVSRIMGKYRYRVVARATDENLLRRAVNEAYLKLTAKKPPGVSCGIDIAGGGML